MVTQVMKQVFEGSESLQTDIKYKDSTKISPQPVILTLNAHSFSEAFKWLPSEKANFETRCTVNAFLVNVVNTFLKESESAKLEGLKETSESLGIDDKGDFALLIFTCDGCDDERRRS